jgi:hypothetical protein
VTDTLIYETTIDWVLFNVKSAVYYTAIFHDESNQFC